MPKSRGESGLASAIGRAAGYTNISENLIQTQLGLAATGDGKAYGAQFSGHRPRGAAGRAARARLAGTGQDPKLLHRGVGINVNDIADAAQLPQSTVSSNLQILEDAGLIRTETQKGRKGNQKLCFSTFDEVLVMFREDVADAPPT